MKRTTMAKGLRTRMAGAIFGSLLLLWAVVMLILHAATTDRIQLQITNSLDRTETMVRRDIQNIFTGDLPEVDRRALLEYYLSNYAGMLNSWEGGLTLRLYDVDGTERARTQLAYGMADLPGDRATDSGRISCQLSMDEALESDEKLLQYVDWIVAHRDRSNGYELRESEDTRYPGDGTVARITGVMKDNHIRVSRIALRHPDGSETIVLEGEEGLFAGEALTTVDCTGLTLESPLLPGMWWNNEGSHTEKVDLKARLARYRFTEEKLDAFYAEEGAPTNMSSSGGYVNYGGDPEGASLAIGFFYDGDALAHKELLTTYLFTLLVALGLGWYLATYLSRKLSQPLEELSAAVEGGNPCAEDGSVREVNTLAAAFNAAQKKLSDDLKREQDLTRAVAHELKTPLAILRSHAEALSEDIDPAKREQYLHILMDKSDRMGLLVGELLDLARLEAGAEECRREWVDLEALTRRVFRRIETLAHVTLNLAPVSAQGDATLLERALSNYASNALRHVREGGEISVTLTAKEGTARLTVYNDGEPIPPDALPRLWDTFYKADAARTRGQGTGLGLAIVRSVAQLHGGDCGAENLPQGVAFYLSLPCN